VGSKFGFVAISHDVINGSSLHDANVNLMLLPGRMVNLHPLVSSLIQSY
jgi:hypothetical protein